MLADVEPREPYLVQSRRPLAAAAFVLVAVVVLHTGLWFSDADRPTTGVLIVHGAAELAGRLTPGEIAVLLAMAAVLAPLVAHVFAGQRWRLRKRLLPAMAAESAVLALPLVAMSLVLFPSQNLLSTGTGLGWLVAIEAGIFEELVFRMAGFALVDVLVGLVLGHDERARTITLGAAVVVTSLAFAGHHYLPLTQEPFEWPSFIFRALAGVWLGVVFLTRGFGLAVGCHIAYNAAIL
ncbi:MAG: CPBP family intramembrane glutamic endopeptidase [Planctomycetota bacterium]